MTADMTQTDEQVVAGGGRQGGGLGGGLSCKSWQSDNVQVTTLVYSVTFPPTL